MATFILGLAAGINGHDERFSDHGFCRVEKAD
jgi:hypothetical protein